MKRLYLLFAVLSVHSNAIAQDPARASGWVVIPVNEYGALRGKAYPVVRGDSEDIPVEATLTRVDYDLRLEGALASGRASLTIDVLKNGWVRVPIPAGLVVREATLGGKPVALVPAPDKAGQMSAEGRQATVDLNFQKERKGGVK